MNTESFSNIESTKSENLDRELVEIIKNAVVRLDDRITILLVASEVKPVGRVEVEGLESFLFFEKKPQWQGKKSPLEQFYNLGVDHKEDLVNQINELEKLFKKLGLLYFVEWNNNPSKTPVIYYSKYKELLENAKNAKNSKELGLALGYPQSAVEAFQSVGKKNDSTMRSVDLPEEEKAKEFYPFIGFRLSKNNWQEEIQTVQRWSEVLKKNSPELFDEYVEEFKRRKKEYPELH